LVQRLEAGSVTEPNDPIDELEQYALDVEDELRGTHPAAATAAVDPQPGLPFADVPPPSDADAPGARRGRRDPNDPRPEIVLSTDQPAVVDAAERALLAYGGIYVRGRQLVRVVRDRGSSDWLRRPDGMPVIMPIGRDHLLDLLGRAAVWLAARRTKHGGTVVETAVPPPWVAARLLERGEWILPQLESISDAPVLRPDGTIHATPGYDPTTRVIFDPCGVTFPAVPREPTQGDAADALAELLEPFSEFPVIAQCDRIAIAALILSIIGRPAIDGSVPMFSSQAPTPGSGKGLLVDAVSMIVTGRRAALMAPTDDDDETRKRLLALALESPAMVVIDNVEGSLGSASLAMALTAGQVSDRQLGSTKMLSASLRPVWCCTGNNVQLKGDLGRRVVPIDLDPRCEHPEDRVFARQDLLGYVQGRRPDLVTAALTILRAFFAAGCPDHGRPAKGSFEAWDRLVRGALLWCSGVDALEGVQRIRERSDDDLERIRALLLSWSDTCGPMPITLADAIRRAEHSDRLRDAMGSYCRTGRPEAKTLGYVLRRIQGRVVGGLVMQRSAANRDGIALWHVVTETHAHGVQ
jgi:putative DNA primase/helicase